MVGSGIGGSGSRYDRRRDIAAALASDQTITAEVVYGLRPKEMIALYGDARIVVNDGGPRHLPITMRVFEALGAGALLLTEDIPGTDTILNRGEHYDDLLQVGTIGLIKAIDRFDAERGVEFSTYATPTIVGEIKRHFRDKSWAIRVPRRLQELRASISTVTAELTQDLGRSPTVAEIAGKVGVTEEEIIEGLESANAYTTLSLDAGDSAEDSALSMLDTIGEDDEALEHVENRESLKPLLEALDPREKHILTLRFFRGMTQSQIAAEIGVSQMHVSRLLNKTLAQLRERLTEDPSLDGGALRR